MVFYRKYRPQKIEDLDSKSVRDTLNAVLKKDIPHAFLFTGPKGLGKTSTARIVAKVVNCEKRGKNSIEPCDSCDQCLSTKNGTNIDILEIDAASNRGIDEIRDLKEKIRLAPVAAKMKVYIIDEVHMLTTEAFNALLKTLEEPPEHAMFILCTTEAHKVPQTIVSRCFQLLFKPATEEELVRSFKRIVEGEKIKIDDAALQYIAQLSDRGFRDGVKVLEEVVLRENSSENNITKESIDSYYKKGIVSEKVSLLLFSLKDRKVKQSLGVVKELLDQGMDIRNFIASTLDMLHEILLRKMGIVNENKFSLEAHTAFEIDELKLLMELFSKAFFEMKNAVLPQLPLELAIIEWCEKGQTHEKNNTQLSNQSVQISSSSTSASVGDLRKQVGTIKKLKALYGDVKQVSKKDEDVPVTSVELMQTNGSGPVTQDWLDLFWKNFIGEMKKYNHTVAGVLRGCVIKSYSDKKLVIETSYKFHKERLDDRKNKDALMKISKLLTGKDVEITVELRK